MHSKFLIFSSVVLLLTTSLISCSKDNPEKVIVGKWGLVEYLSDDYEPEACDFLSTLQFNSDGTYVEYDGCEKENSTGLYEVSETILSVISDEFPITIGFQIISLTNRTLSFSVEGVVLTYEKI
jgi:hypothetical protein